MSSRRGLLSRSRRSETSTPSRPTTRRPQRSAADDDDPDELPPYEPPSLPLNDEGRRALAALLRSRDAEKYETHIKAALEMLKESTVLINDRLYARRHFAAHAASRAKTKKGDARAEWEAAAREADEAAAPMEESVSDLTTRSEAAVRRTIDLRAELEDDRRVVAGLPDQVAAHQPAADAGGARDGQGRPRRQRQGGDEDEDDGMSGEQQDEDVTMQDDQAEEEEPQPPEVGVPELLRRGREASAADYAGLGAYEKYGLNNDYANFKRTWHDAVNQSDEVPLPDARDWFDEDGRPRSTDRGHHRGHGGSEEDDDEGEDDEDLVVEREIRDYRCPISLQIMKEPYTSRLCHHSFEREAILSLLKVGRGVIPCPVPGCGVQEMRASDLELDELMIRKIKRALKAAKEEEEDESSSDMEPEDEEVEEQDDSNASHAKAKSELGERIRRSKREVEDIEDMEDE